MLCLPVDLAVCLTVNYREEEASSPPTAHSNALTRGYAYWPLVNSGPGDMCESPGHGVSCCRYGNGFSEAVGLGASEAVNPEDRPMSSATVNPPTTLTWERIETGHYHGMEVPNGPASVSYEVLRGDHERLTRLYPSAQQDRWYLIVTSAGRIEEGRGPAFPTRRAAVMCAETAHRATIEAARQAATATETVPLAAENAVFPEQLFRMLMTDVDRKAYDLGVSEAGSHPGVTADMAMAYFSDANRELGMNTEAAPNRHALYWHGVADTLRKQEAAIVANRPPTAWKTLPGLALSPHHPQHVDGNPPRTVSEPTTPSDSLPYLIQGDYSGVTPEEGWTTVMEADGLDAARSAYRMVGDGGECHDFRLLRASTGEVVDQWVGMPTAGETGDQAGDPIRFTTVPGTRHRRAMVVSRWGAVRVDILNVDPGEWMVSLHHLPNVDEPTSNLTDLLPLFPRQLRDMLTAMQSRGYALADARGAGEDVVDVLRDLSQLKLAGWES